MNFLKIQALIHFHLIKLCSANRRADSLGSESYLKPINSFKSRNLCYQELSQSGLRQGVKGIHSAPQSEEPEHVDLIEEHHNQLGQCRGGLETSRPVSQNNNFH